MSRQPAPGNHNNLHPSMAHRRRGNSLFPEREPPQAGSSRSFSICSGQLASTARKSSLTVPTRGGSKRSSLSPTVLESKLEEEELIKPDDEPVDNSKIVLKRIAALYADKLLSDLTLDVDGRTYTAHRIILCTASDVFQVMLMNPNFTESSHNKITLQEEPACQVVFPTFLKYLYTGQVTLNHERVLPVMTLADKYNVRDLVNLCLDYMMGHIISASSSNVLISWLHYSLAYDHDTLSRACMNFACWNFDQISKCSDFYSLHVDVLISFLKKDDLIIEDEYSLFLVVCNWITNQVMTAEYDGCGSPSPDISSLHDGSSSVDGGSHGPSSLDPIEHLIRLTMEHIRFPLMSPKQIASLLLHPLVIQYKDFFIPHMSAAMTFHSEASDNGMACGNSYCTSLSVWSSGASGQPNSSFSRSPSSSRANSTSIATNTRPRLYTTAKWCDALLIEDFTSFPIYGKSSLVFSTSCSFRDVVEYNSDRRPSSRSSTGTNVSAQSGSHSPAPMLSHNIQTCNHTGGQYEWVVELFPKGVWYKPFAMITWTGTQELPEFVFKTVRLTISTDRPTVGKVRIGILISGQQHGNEYVSNVIQKTAQFTQDELKLVFNDVVPFESINASPLDQTFPQPPIIQSNGFPIYQQNLINPNASPPPSFLLGEGKNALKIHVTIMPVFD